MNSDPLQIVKRFIDAINRHDVPALLALMSPDHGFIDSLGNRIEGMQQLATAWQGYFQMVPDYQLEISSEFVSGFDVALFGTAAGTLSVDGVLLPENRWSVPVAIRASVAGQQLREWQIYADNEPIRSVMRGRIERKDVYGS